jgi:hypothetical protein
MAKLQKYEPPEKPAHGPTELHAIADPETKALAAIKLDEYATTLGREARTFRDEGIRAMKEAGIPMPEIARRLRLSLGLVKAATPPRPLPPANAPKTAPRKEGSRS